VPTLPADNAPLGVVMTGAGGTIVMVNVTATEAPPELDAVTEKVNAPVVVGVPDMTPVEVLSESPGGGEPDVTAQLVGLFVAARGKL